MAGRAEASVVGASARESGASEGWVRAHAPENSETTAAPARPRTLQPIVEQVEQTHLGLGRLGEEVAELLQLERRLERQLQFSAAQHNVWEVELHGCGRTEERTGMSREKGDGEEKKRKKKKKLSSRLR